MNKTEMIMKTKQSLTRVWPQYKSIESQYLIGSTSVSHYVIIHLFIPFLGKHILPSWAGTSTSLSLKHPLSRSVTA